MARTFALELALNLQQFRKGMQEVATGLANGVKAGAAGLASSLKPAADGVREIGQAAKEAQVAMLALSGAAAMGLRSMISNAADDETAARRFAAAFGDAAEQAGRFAEELASGSRRGVGEIQTLMAEFQDFAMAQGAAREDAAKLSQDLTARAVDLAGYYGRDVKDVMGALQQAMLGAGRSARVFGVNMDETAVKAKAMALGFDPNALQPWQEAMVRSSLILDQTKDKAGKAGAQAGTFTEELRAMATQFGELMSDVGKPLIDFLKPAMNAIRWLVLEFRGFLNQFPLLKTVLGYATAGMLAFVAAAGLAATVISPLITMIQAGRVALAGYAAQAKAAALSNVTFGTTAAGASAGVSKLTLAVSVLAAAFIGWEIGKKIRELADLDGAVDRAAKGQETLGDSFRHAFTAVAGGPVLGALYLSDLNTIREAQQGMKKSVEEINALADARIAKMNEEQRALVKQLELWGASHGMASILAGDELKLLKWLEGQVKAGKGNAAILELLARLRLRNADALKKETGAMESNKSWTEKLLNAKEELKKGEEELLEVIEDIGQDILRAREGESAVEAATLSKQLSERLAKLERAAQRELTVLQGLARERAELEDKAQRSADDSKRLKAIESEYAQHQANLNRTRQAILGAEEAYNLKLRGVYQKRLEDLRSQKGKEIQEVKDSTQKLVDTYEKAIGDIESKLDQLRSKREAGEADATDFIREYERKALREHDARQLELQDLESAAGKALMGAQHEGKRAQIVEIAAAEAKKLADQSERAVELEREIADLKEKRRDARMEEDSDPQEIANLTKELAAKEAELANERKLQTERQKQYEEMVKRLLDKTDESRDAAKMDNAELDRLEYQRKTYQDAILTAKEKELTASKNIEESYKAQIGYVEKLLTLIGQKPKEAQALMAQGASGVGAPSTAEAGAAVAEAESAAQQSAEAAKAVAAATATAFTMATTLAQAVQDHINPLKSEIAGVTKWASEMVASINQVLPKVLVSIGGLLEKQREFSAAVNQFGTVSLDKFGQIQESLVSHKTAIQEITAKINLLDMRQSVDTGLAAQGY